MHKSKENTKIQTNNIVEIAYTDIQRIIGDCIFHLFILSQYPIRYKKAKLATLYPFTLLYFNPHPKTTLSTVKRRMNNVHSSIFIFLHLKRGRDIILLVLINLLSKGIENRSII